MSNSLAKAAASLKGSRVVVLSQPIRHVMTAPPQEFNRRIIKEASSVRPPSNFLRAVYANLFRRNTVYFTLIIGSALVFTGVYNSAMDKLWEWNNRGKLFHEVIPKQFPNLPPNTEPEAAPAEEGGEENGEEETEE